ncbi:hypothetical protein I302_108085 [Kwoniella bestiolae CBS 10118]|uniref:Calpain catalytic domain-containing protein n=1 Tax=Kwoniella bestiolae CBS 10118 TaxID=1296100 RepID=A0A1B9FWP2_9TREE|nr:hypothetical protein I302_07549 [Kwoniella bestiolae CBS 10118]OCF23195.1 hypothetical protein I302_07549 [Kwoniella bestiolae CBS 10118]
MYFATSSWLLVLGTIAAAHPILSAAVAHDNHTLSIHKRGDTKEFYGTIAHEERYKDCRKKKWKSDWYLSVLAAWTVVTPEGKFKETMKIEAAGDKATFALHDIHGESQVKTIEHSAISKDADGPKEVWWVAGSEAAIGQIPDIPGATPEKLKEGDPSYAIWALTGQQPYEGEASDQDALLEEIKAVKDKKALLVVKPKKGQDKLKKNHWSAVITHERSTKDDTNVQFWDPQQDGPFWIPFPDFAAMIETISKIEEELVAPP